MATNSATLYPVADAYVTDNGYGDDKNNGTEPYIACGHYSDGTTVESYIQYDLSGIPPGSRIESAHFLLTQWDSPNDWLVPTITARVVLAGGAWSETGVTWNNKPDGLSGSPTYDVAFNNLTGAGSGSIDFNVTAHVQGIVNGQYPNYGFRLFVPAAGTSNAKYLRSREYTSQSARPTLIIQYDPSPLKINVGGAWKTTPGVWVNVGGVWRQVVFMQMNVGGTWKTLLS